MIKEGKQEQIVSLVNAYEDKSYIVDSRGSSLLHHIVAKPINDIKTIIAALLDNGLEVNAPNGQGESPLILAAKYQKIGVVQYLLRREANINLPDDRGNTPILMACSHQRNLSLEIIETLIKANANIDDHSRKGSNCLNKSIAQGNIALFNFLLENGASVNPSYKSADSPLHLAVKKGSLLFIEQLIKAGAKTEKENQHGYTPLFVALQPPNVRVARKLIKLGANVNFVKNRRASIAETVVKSRDAELLKFMLAHGLNLNASEVSYPELAVAVKNNNFETVKYYLQLGIDPNLFHKDKNDLVSLAVRDKNFDIRILKLLISAGAKLDEKNSHYDSALIQLALRGDLDTVKLLVNAGADVNVGDFARTPLSIATSRQYHELALFLIESGANLIQRDIRNKQPLNYVIKYYDGNNKSRELLETLITQGASLDPRFKTDTASLKKVKTPAFDRELKIKILSSVGNHSINHSVTTKTSPKVSRVKTKEKQPPTKLSFSKKSELHVVGVYEGKRKKLSRQNSIQSRRQNTIKVNIPNSNKPVILALTAYDPVHWEINSRNKRNIEHIILSGYHDQTISGISSDIPLSDLQRNTSRGGGLPYAYKEGSRKYHLLKEKLKKLTGKEIHKFYGDYSGSEYTLKIGYSKDTSSTVYKWEDDNGRVHFGDKMPE